MEEKSIWISVQHLVASMPTTSTSSRWLKKPFTEDETAPFGQFWMDLTLMEIMLSLAWLLNKMEYQSAQTGDHI